MVIAATGLATDATHRVLGILADHESNPSLRRTGLALLIAIALLAVGAAIYGLVRRSAAASWAHRVAAAAMAALVVGCIAGSIQRSSPTGDAQCGPVFFEPRSSAVCEGAMDALRSVALVGVGVGAALLTVGLLAVVASRRRSPS